MERLWSQAGATTGNQWQIAGRPLGRKQAKFVAVRCDQLPEPSNGKEGVDVAPVPPAAIQSRQGRVIERDPVLFATLATTHPALIRQEVPGSSRTAPQIPATPEAESPALGGNPRLSPVSPEAPRPACHAGGRGFESRRSR
jgi:hypothetical protein